MSRSLVALLALPLPLVLQGCCCCSGCPDAEPLTPEQQAIQDARERVDIDALEAGLMTVAASPPSARGLSESACPDADIAAKDWSARQLLTVDREYLVHLADPEFDSSMDDNPAWAWLRSEALRNASKGADKFTDADLDSDRQRHYLAVFDSTDKRPPVIDGSGEYTPGHFDGWLIVVDLISHQPVCQVVVVADSSPRVADALEGAIRDQQEAADEDFQEVFATAAEAALGRISEQLRISLDWTN